MFKINQNGWSVNKDGNFLTWNANEVIYSNNGCNVIVAPLKLLAFNAKGLGNSAELFWQTTNELNVKNFDVQWSNDGINFVSAKTIEATGSYSSVKNYSTLVSNILAGPNYYRLKIVDNDGAFSYSQAIKITGTGKNGGIKVYEPGTSGLLNIEWQAKYATGSMISVFDYSGRKIFSRNLYSLIGRNNVSIPINKLSTGVYVIQVMDKTEFLNTTFYKK